MSYLDLGAVGNAARLLFNIKMSKALKEIVLPQLQ